MAAGQRALVLGVALAVAVAVAVAAAVATAAPAAAQADLGCAPDVSIDERIGQAPTVFTGTVRALANKGRTATVEVIRVWKGDTLPKRVEVQGTIATQAKVFTALDRLYARNRTYLFLPPSGGSPRFRENRCSATQELTTALAAKAPPDGGRVPQGEGLAIPGGGVGKFAPLMIGVPAFLLLAGVLVGARRRSRRPRRADA